MGCLGFRAQGGRHWCWRFEVRGWRQKIIGIRRKANGKGCQEFRSQNAEVGKKELFEFGMRNAECGNL